MKIIRDIEGKIINIGEWDYLVSTEPNGFGEEIINIGNPMPEGAVETDEDVITGWDGGLYVADDPRAISHE